jgi:hypothetical protein
MLALLTKLIIFRPRPFYTSPKNLYCIPFLWQGNAGLVQGEGGGEEGGGEGGGVGTGVGAGECGGERRGEVRGEGKGIEVGAGDGAGGGGGGINRLTQQSTNAGGD